MSHRQLQVLLVVELANYEKLAEQARLLLGEDGVKQLEAQIERMVQSAIRATKNQSKSTASLNLRYPNIVLRINDPDRASRIAAIIHQDADEYNKRGSGQNGHRYFRIIIRRVGIAGSEEFVKNAPAAVHTGEILVEDAVWQLFGDKESVLYSRDVIQAQDSTFINIYRRKVIDRAPWDKERRIDVHPLCVSVFRLKDVKGVSQALLELSDSAADSPGWYVLAGGNASGKTTLLRSIAAASIGDSSVKVLDSSWIRATCDQAIIEAEYLPLSENDESSKLTSRIELRCNEKAPRFISSESFGSVRFRCCVAGYGAFKRLSGMPSEVLDFFKNDRQLEPLLTLFSEDFFLDGVRQWLRATFDENGEMIRKVVPLLNSGLLPEGYTVEGFKDGELKLSAPDGTPFSWHAASDGIRCMLAMILDMLRCFEECYGNVDIRDDIVHDAGIVLIDEPDNHLHVLWQMRLASWMKKHFPRVQFIVASHSPFICVGADKIWRLDDENGVVNPRALSDDEMKEIQNGTVFRILESDAFRVFNTLSPEAQDRHADYLRLRKLSLQGKRLSKADQERLEELQQEMRGPQVPEDPEFNELFA